MFFWFANDSFTFVNAILKLILVITGSTLIICLCHKFTNYKKSSRTHLKHNNFNQHNLPPPRYTTSYHYQGNNFNTLSLQQQHSALFTSLLAYQFSQHLNTNQRTQHAISRPPVIYFDENSVPDQFGASNTSFNLATNGSFESIEDPCPSYEVAVGLSAQRQHIDQQYHQGQRQEENVDNSCDFEEDGIHIVEINAKSDTNKQNTNISGNRQQQEQAQHIDSLPSQCSIEIENDQ